MVFILGGGLAWYGYDVDILGLWIVMFFPVWQFLNMEVMEAAMLCIRHWSSMKFWPQSLNPFFDVTYRTRITLWRIGSAAVTQRCFVEPCGLVRAFSFHSSGQWDTVTIYHHHSPSASWLQMNFRSVWPSTPSHATRGSVAQWSMLQPSLIYRTYL